MLISTHKDVSISFCRAAERIALKLRGAAAAIKTNPFPFKRPPHPDSFKRWLGGVPAEALNARERRIGVDLPVLNEFHGCETVGI